MNFLEYAIAAIRYDLFYDVLAALYFLAPLWVPLLLFVVFLNSWLTYIRMDYVLKQGFTVLEIKLPKEILKSPAAMEIVFTSLYQTGAVTELDTYFRGKIRPWFSFEMVSFEGHVKFFVWTLLKWKDHIEAQIYGQYPTVEIHEVPDYTRDFQHDLSRWFMWITYFTFERPDVYPIKTYVDYGLDADPKEEHKIEPMASVLEYLGSLRKGEYAWIQILIQAHKKEKFKDGRIIPKPDWTVEAKAEIEKIRKESIIQPESEGAFPLMAPTKGQQDTIAAIERSILKFPFECAIRGAYIAKNESMNPIHINGLIGTFRQYSSPNLNGFKLGVFTDFDYPWQDFRRIRRTHREKEFLEAYKLRSFFQPPFKNFDQTPIILTTEELATIYHFPGSAVQTPTFDRIPSKKAEPPANLPI